MAKRDRIAIFTTLLAFVFFVPGIFLPMLSLRTEGKVATPVSESVIQAPEYSSSILQTVKQLFTHNNMLTATLIFVFSVIIPLLKGSLLIYALRSYDVTIRQKTLKFLKAISKWSMNDVFIVAIFLAYYSTTTGVTKDSNETTILGIPLNVDLNMYAELQVGFYCFLAYCLLALIALQIYED